MNGGKALRRGNPARKAKRGRYWATHKAKRARGKKHGGNRRSTDKLPLILI